ncbi:MAG: hypothetical protein ACQGVK_14725 [Myxococcota bacterium]
MSDDWPHPEGVVHVVAVWRPATWEDDRPGRVLRVTDTTPRSDTDAFLLALARARADAVLTSGSILRAEPGLSFEAGPRVGAAEALARWRRSRLGKTGPAVPAVLSRGEEGSLDWDHPVFARGGLVLTGAAAAARIPAGARRRGVRALPLESPGAREAVQRLTGELGLADVDVELGPGAGAALYEPPVGIDELWLSTHLEPDLPRALRGGAFLSPRAIRALFGEPVARTLREEASGRWSFERFRRRDGRA